MNALLPVVLVTGSGTPAWLTAVIGAGAVVAASLITLVGVVVTQRRADRKERQHRTDDRAWRHQDWARERKREAHAAYIAEAGRLDRLAAAHSRGDYGNDLADDWTWQLVQLHVDVSLFASTEAAAAAQDLHAAILAVAEEGSPGSLTRSTAAMTQYRHAVQDDLGLPRTNLPDWSASVATTQAR
ncbi:hypothetical protein [uncultured Pseudokineococcus sp.]|uniref:hypothetical protein n=1 Tax=uncultured Pseudokineococcus sp. TaxID=1642928 RepID=UPI002636711D|nr:hypothetical protein [uncultured Pseudokineococcus sp.]